MRDDIENLISKIKNIINPSIIAYDIDSFVNNSIRENKISFYEAYMINMEKIRFERLGYIQPAWERQVGINVCMSILNQKLLAHVFEEPAIAEKLKEIGIEAYNLYNLKRKHYIMDRYNTFLDANNSPKLLDELQTDREYYEELSFDEGPYHVEVFPYHYYSPEKILLDNKDNIVHDKNLSEDIEDLIVELNMI